MSARTRPLRRELVGGLLAGSLVVSMSACGSGSEGQAASPPTTATPTTAAPPTTAPAPSATAAPDPVDTTAPAPTTAPGPTIPAEPVRVREMMSLSAGWPYVSGNFQVPFSFDIPGDDSVGRWRMLFDTSNYLILTLNVTDRAEPSVIREEPGVSFYALPEDVTADEFLALWTAYAAEQDVFELEISEGAYLGERATVVSGTYDLGEPTDGARQMRLGDSMVVPIASGERTFISYLVPVGDRTVMVQINAHALDFEMNVTLVNQIVESVEFL